MEKNGKIVKRACSFIRYLRVFFYDDRYPNFWVGMYGELWVMAWEYLVDIIQVMMNLNPHKKQNYHRGLKAMSRLLH